jgi:cytoskeletal protein CcmA (bactofilin family)
MSFFGNRRQQPEPTPPPVAESASEPRPFTPQQPVGFETVLGANSTVEGTLRSNANVRLDGTFTGTLEISGNVLVGETAKINADINAKNVSIAGAVRGNVSGKKVQLLRTGRVWGDITAAALTTEEGAFIDGKITMVSHDQPRPEAGSPDATLVLDDNPTADETAPEQPQPQAATTTRSRRRQRPSEEGGSTGASAETTEPAPDEQSEQ